jgi:hypothetical protein
MFAAFQSNAFQNNAFQTIVTPIVIFDMHDGGPKKRKREADKKKQRRDEIIALFEQIVEGKPSVARQIAEPYIKEATINNSKPINLKNNIDFDALIANLDKVQQIYEVYIELDDDEVLALL